MADCLVGYVKNIGKSIITQCLWPPIKDHIDYWWYFDNNIQGLRDAVGDLNRERVDVNRINDQGRLRLEKPRTGFEEWSNAGTGKLAEASTILQDNNIPKPWNLISRYSMGKRVKRAAEEIAKLRDEANLYKICDPARPPAEESQFHKQIMEFKSRKQIEEEFIECLRSSSVSMIGICGMGGVGKTTLVQSITKRVEFDEVVMVVVSQQIDMLKIQKEIAELLKLEFSVETIAHKLRTRLMDKKKKNHNL